MFRRHGVERSWKVHPGLVPTLALPDSRGLPFGIQRSKPVMHCSDAMIFFILLYSQSHPDAVVMVLSVTGWTGDRVGHPRDDDGG